MGRFGGPGNLLKENEQTADLPHMKLHAVKAIFCLILASVTFAPVNAQDADEASARSKILALEHAWNQAEPAKDLKALDVLFDNGFVYVDFDGTLMTKADFLSCVKAGHLQQVATQSMSVEVFGNTAIVTGTYQSSELLHGKRVLRRGRFVDTWVYKGNSWVCVAAQSTPILP